MLYFPFDNLVITYLVSYFHILFKTVISKCLSQFRVTPGRGVQRRMNRRRHAANKAESCVPR